MKRFLLLGFAFIIAFSNIWAQKWTDVAAVGFDSGSGSVTDPYIIKNDSLIFHLQ